jgi:hypothetical protein
MQSCFDEFPTNFFNQIDSLHAKYPQESNKLPYNFTMQDC